LIGVFDEAGENLSGLRLKVDEDTLTAKFKGCAVELEQTKSKPSRLHFAHEQLSHGSRSWKAIVLRQNSFY
jgi:hypothetical protein